MAGWIYDLFGWDNRPGLLQGTVSDTTVESIPASFVVIEPPQTWGRPARRRRLRGLFRGGPPAQSFVESIPGRFFGGGRLLGQTGDVNARAIAGRLRGAAIFHGVRTEPATVVEKRKRTVAFLAAKSADGKMRIVIFRRRTRRARRAGERLRGTFFGTCGHSEVS